MSEKTNAPGPIVSGQRWISESEPELGLGTVTEIDARSMVVEFAAADQLRRYAIKTAPLRRVRFAAGDVIKNRDEEEFVIEAVHEEDGLLVYLCGGHSLREASISDHMALGTPRERLLSGRADAPRLFDLRLETMSRFHEARKSPARGFLGPRIELLPHQFSIAAEVTRRRRPRVLLADETGLGKTIEAGLILNRLLISGRAQRVFVLVPDSLVHQWLIELRRRFNLRIALFDEERCQAIEQSDEDANPFSSEQLILASLDLIAADPLRARQAATAGWDVVVVDEAHHLRWDAQQPSAAYLAVEAVAANSGGLLLLSATPEQLGQESHFARLRLLDPDRYSDFSLWKHEAEKFREVAVIAGRLEQGLRLEDRELRGLASTLAVGIDEIHERCANADGRRRLLNDLIDRHGPGRAMFRNTRTAIPRLPERDVHLHRLVRRGGDPRIDWMLEMLTGSAGRKSLVICHSAVQAQALKAAIEERRRTDIALFHEGLTILQRDRNAAWFADPAGARLLVCSEIGSEGRNFQHVQHLVMFDLPLDPDLIEQRIGRLDRIGQKGTVHVDVLFETGSEQEVLARWHAEGVGSFDRHSLTGSALLECFGEQVRELAAGAGSGAFDKPLQNLIDRTMRARTELGRRIEEGRDRLLEMCSLRHDLVDPLIERIQALDGDTDLDDFFLRLMEHFHVYAEEIGHRLYHLNPDAMHCTEFPALERGDTSVSFDRDTALVRENLEFMSWDHRLFGDAAELLLASGSGNASFALIEQPGPPLMELEAVFVLESVAPMRLHVDRFLPPTPIHIHIDQTGSVQIASDAVTGNRRTLETGRAAWIAEHRATLQPLLSKLIAESEQLAKAGALRVRDQAATAIDEALGGELERLRALAMVNREIRSEEIDELKQERVALQLHVRKARLRLDALRVIWRGPCKEGSPDLRA